MNSLESHHGESLGLSVDAVLVEADFEQVVHLQTLDRVLKILVRRPPSQVTYQERAQKRGVEENVANGS